MLQIKMYRLYLVCIMSAMVLGNSDEAKYIDLLPEEEKQEFLNRIARRIIDEMQSKDSPEQSHVEVSDDQLNAHNAYVQDLIKEESANLRSERRDNIKEHGERPAGNADLKKDNVAEGNNHEIDEPSQHINLTLRNDGQKENKKRKLTDETTFNVIPVKVIYDQDDIMSIQSTPNSALADEVINNNLTNNNYSENSYFNASNIELGKVPTLLSNISTENGNENKSDTKSTYNNSEVYEDQFETKIKYDIEKISSISPNLTHNLEINSTKTQLTTETIFVTSFSKGTNNYENSTEKIESSTKINIHSNENTEINKHSSAGKNVLLSTNIARLLPLTTDSMIQSDFKESESGDITSAIVYVTTVRSLAENPIKNSYVEDNVDKKHNVKDTFEIETQKIKSNEVKNHLKKGLETVSDENKFDTYIESNKTKILRTGHIKPYIVYEVPEEKPIYVQVDEPKQEEQPYVVPIYNFAPKNAYYNAYNQFGVNNDEEVKLVNETPNQDIYGVLDRELHLRSGFKIDLNPKTHNYQEGKKEQYKYPIQHPRHPHWVHIIDSNFEYNPNTIDYHENKYVRQNSKRDSNFKQINRLNETKDKFSIPLHIPNKIKYIPLRQRVDNEYDNNNDDDDADSNRLGHKPLNHVGHKNYVDQPKNFGFQHQNPKSIELDYYFGKYRMNNRSDDVDFDDEYPEIEEETRADIHNIRHRKIKNLNIKHHRIKLESKFDNYLKSLVKVFKDMIYRDNNNLVTYDWLLSTVDIRSAVKKLKDLTDDIEKGNYIHPLDLKLLNYVVYLYNTANEFENTIQTRKESEALQDINYIVNSFLKLLRRRIALPRNKNRKPGIKIPQPFRLWHAYYVRYGLQNDDVLGRNPMVLRSFKIFLKNLEDNMFELHNALEHISSITTYSNQNWYRDLKSIYLKSASTKQLLQVILHLAASRLLGSIEETAKMVEEDEDSIDINGKVFKRIQNEFVYVLKILERMKETK